MLAGWWSRLEAAPQFAGPRRHLRDLLGQSVVDFLERTRILRHRGVADHYPCKERGGDGCPRHVIEIDGTYQAVCGNGGRECDDVALTAHDVALLMVDLLRLCNLAGAALGVRGRPELLHDLAGVCRVGSIIPEPGLRYPVFFVIRPTSQGYGEALAALALRQPGTPFGILVPTAGLIRDDAERTAAGCRSVIVPLTDALLLTEGGFTATPAARDRIAGLGARTVGAGGGVNAVVAQALVCDGKSPPRWHDLGEDDYTALLAAAGDYEVLVDQRRCFVQKRGSAERAVPGSYFAAIRSAVKSHRQYDPGASEVDQKSAKQTFQRARNAFDPGSSNGGWRIFKTARHPEGHALYSFQPDPGVSFAFIFHPDR